MIITEFFFFIYFSKRYRQYLIHEYINLKISLKINNLMIYIYLQ